MSVELEEFANKTRKFGEFWSTGVMAWDDEPSLALNNFNFALKRLIIPDYIIVDPLKFEHVSKVYEGLKDTATITLKMLVEANVNGIQVFFRKQSDKISELVQLEYEALHDAAESFKTVYQNREALVKYALNAIDQNLRLYKDKTAQGYHSCYTSVVQGSMVGKSRRMQECLQEVFGFYINFLQGGTAYPMRTVLVSDWVINNLKGGVTTPTARSQGEKNAFGFLTACLESFSSWLDSYQLATPYRDAIKDWNRFQEHALFWSEIISKATAYGNSLDPELRFSETLISLQSKLDDFLPKLTSKGLFPEILRVLFVFDEARDLLKGQPDSNPFLSIRTALKECLRDNPFMFALFADTNSRLTNFSPTFNKFSSSRASEVKRTKLFKPMYGIQSFDVWPECSVLNQSMQNIVKPMFFSMFGRAALHAHMLMSTKPKETDRASKLLRLLTDKLVDRTVSETIEDNDLHSALSLLSFRVKLSISPEKTLPQELVASKMQICSGISDDRTLIFLNGTAEPMIALAAKNVIKDRGWLFLLQQLSKCVTRLEANVGANGEALSQMVMLMAADIVHDSSELSKNMIRDSPDLKLFSEERQCVLPISLVDFLKKLLGDKLDYVDSKAHKKRSLVPSLEVPSITQQLENVFIRLLSFDRLHQDSYQISNELMAMLFYRSAGMMMDANCAAIDALIPLLHSEQSVIDSSISPDMFSAMTVQFKNYHQAPPMSTYRGWLNAMRMEFVCPNVAPPKITMRVALLIDLGAEDELKVYRFILENEPIGVHTIALAVRGLKPSHFIPKDKQTDSIEADSCFSALRGNSDKTDGNIALAISKSMFPYQYQSTVAQEIEQTPAQEIPAKTGVKRKAVVKADGVKKRP